MSYNLAISIGVSNPGGGLEPLPGAINGAGAFADWAESQGYRTMLVTDGDGSALTLEVLQSRIQPALDEDRKIDRLIVYFAGHGCAQYMDDYWLLSGFKTDGAAAIHLASLRAYLSQYQPDQIALIGDACRTFGKEYNLLRGSGVVKLPDIEQRRNVEVETIKAASLGDPAYMKANVNPANARCLFSEILISALNGAEPDAVEVRDNRRIVSSARLRRFLEDAVNTEGGRLQLTIRPQIESGFQHPQDVYVTLPAGPPPTGKMMTRSGMSDFIGEPPTAKIGSVEARKRARAERIDHEAQKADATADILRLLRTPVSAQADRQGPSVTTAGHPVEGIVVSPWMAIRRPDRRSSPGDLSTTWLKHRLFGHEVFSLGVRLQGGACVFGCSQVKLSLAMTVSDRGGLAAILRDDRFDQEYRETETAIAGLISGDLDSGRALDQAFRLRFGKHHDPMRGVVAAYLYDRVGDIDSIRQIAWFFADREQPIPFDVALLAGLPGVRAPSGFRVTIPAVAGRAPRNASEQARPHILDATEERTGFVAGGFPILRQGWSLLRTGRLPVREELAGLAAGLTVAPITTLRGLEADRLSRLIEEGHV